MGHQTRLGGGPLAGIRALEWAAFVAGPGTGYMLADLGADVIKIEDVEHGDSIRGWDPSGAGKMFGNVNISFETANRGKRSLTLNLQNPRGKEILHALVKNADVFYTNYGQDAQRKLGLTYEDLREINPRLVYGWISPCGSLGPGANVKRGYDGLGQARSGLMLAVDPEHPHGVTGNLCDHMTSNMLLQGIMAALLERQRSGQGQMVETSLLGSMIHAQAYHLNFASLAGHPLPRSEGRPGNPLASRYRCKDGEWLLLGEAQGDRFWTQICRAIGREDIAHDPRFADGEKRKAHRDELFALLTETFCAKSRDEWVSDFEEQRVEFAYAPILHINEVLEDEVALANGYVQWYDHPSLGKVRFVGHPARFTRTPASSDGCSPAWGQHTEEVLKELLRYSSEQIADLREKKIV